MTNTGDNGGVDPAPGAGTGTLRQAIVDANATAGADTINFVIPGLPGTITLASVLPLITDSVTISGPGAKLLTVSGASAFRVFNIAGGVTASISSLTISNALFGGILNGGTLTITNSTLSGNSASVGGGISNSGTLTVTNSTFSGNSARMFAGGIANGFGATLTVTNSTFSGNSATAQGGAIENGSGATLAVTNSTFSGNSTAVVASGGGIFNSGTATFKNSIIANSPSGGNCAGSTPINAVGVNYSTDNTCRMMAIRPTSFCSTRLPANTASAAEGFHLLVGTVLVKGCTVTIQHYPANGRVLIKFDGAVGAGTASLQSPPGSIRCTITDRNTKNNTCACQ